MYSRRTCDGIKGPICSNHLRSELVKSAAEQNSSSSVCSILPNWGAHPAGRKNDEVGDSDARFS